MSFGQYNDDGTVRHAAGAITPDGKVINVGYDASEGVQKVATMVWNTSTLAWTRAVQSATTGGTGGSFPVGVGQQPMSGSLPVVLASDQGAISTTQPQASDNWGQSLALTAGATGTLVSIASSAAGYKIKGLVAHGTGDGYFFIQAASLTVLSGRIRSTAPMLTVTLPNGINVPTGSLVALKVTNESGSTADYEATLLGI